MLTSDNLRRRTQAVGPKCSTALHLFSTGFTSNDKSFLKLYLCFHRESLVLSEEVFSFTRTIQNSRFQLASHKDLPV